MLVENEAAKEFAKPWIFPGDREVLIVEDMRVGESFICMTANSEDNELSMIIGTRYGGQNEKEVDDVEFNLKEQDLRLLAAIFTAEAERLKYKTTEE